MTLMILAEAQPARGAAVSARVEKVLRHAAWLADEEGLPSVGTDHLAKALVAEPEGPHVDVLHRAAPRLAAMAAGGPD